jgi:hypothetical protein
MRDAVECAVLSMVHHPGIVQLYACHTDVIDAAAGEGAGRPFPSLIRGRFPKASG